MCIAYQLQYVIFPFRIYFPFGYIFLSDATPLNAPARGLPIFVIHFCDCKGTNNILYNKMFFKIS